MVLGGLGVLRQSTLGGLGGPVLVVSEVLVVLVVILAV